MQKINRKAVARTENHRAALLPPLIAKEYGNKLYPGNQGSTLTSSNGGYYGRENASILAWG